MKAGDPEMRQQLKMMELTVVCLFFPSTFEGESLAAEGEALNKPRFRIDVQTGCSGSLHHPQS